MSPPQIVRTRIHHARTVPVLRDAEETVLDAALELAEAIVGHALAD